MPERVVVTGMGTVNPLGLSVADSWNNVIHGVSGVGPLTLFDPKDLQVRIVCEVKGFVPESYMLSKEVRRRDRVEQLATAATQEAIRQSGLPIPAADPDRVGVFVSSAIGGLTSFSEAIRIVIEEGPRKLSPFVIPMMMTNGSASLIAIDYGFTGPCYSIISACASGADGIGTAWMMIRSGVVDVAITGGVDSTLTMLGIGAFDRLGALSRRGQPDSSGCYHTPQPFDKNRDGLVMGEGAAILVLERESNARARGANILGEIAGYGASADAYHITAPSEDGAGGAKAIRHALKSAGVSPEEVDYINAHGTATPLNDLSETRAIKAAFGDLAYNIPVSSTKSMTGHMMGATGALEAIFCIQALRDGILPATINYDTPDPECDLDYIPNEARPKKIQVAISNSFGFGGHNAVLVFRPCS